MIDPYVYPDSDVLRNLFDIRSQSELDNVEADYTVVALKELISDDSLESIFDFSSLCEIHHHIFKDLYDWAGQPRSIPMEKAEPVLGGLSVEYSNPEDIRDDADVVINEFNDTNWKSLTRKETITKLSELMAKLWRIHPFREGNTRTVTTFVEKFAVAQGFNFDESVFEDNAVFLRNALVAANAYWSDGSDLRKTEYLETIVGDAFKRN